MDAALLHYLAADILLIEAEDKLPPPPRVPVFAALTIRPGKHS